MPPRTGSLPHPTGVRRDEALGTADDVLERLRLRARLTRNEGSFLGSGASQTGGAHRRPRLRLGVNQWAIVGIGIALAVAALCFMAPALAAQDPVASASPGGSIQWDPAGQGGPDTSGGTRAGAAGDDGPGSGGTGADETMTGEADPGVVVYVTGAVVAPGVIHLPTGARLVDAIEEAGGALPEADLTVLNLAARLTDGERIYVPLPGETPPPVTGPGSGPGGGGGISGGSSTAGSGLLNVNTATADQLTALPGIGPVLAQRIVDFRSAHGSFDVLADLGEVSGIGPKVLAGLADMVAF
ncbi:MAG: ComEA family DNA-binding protein [Bifidobacteriaceae bacterium]|nr:ComEA family DNA-binding protein [Bifidobacteriaceae bacterium]